MSGSETYEADFEAEEVSRPAEAAGEEEHHLRLSIEFISVRDLQTTATLYFIYSYPLIGPKPIRSQSITVTRNTECRVDNAYQAVEFFLTRTRLYSTLASTPLVFEVVQTDKYEKNSRLGLATLQMEEVLRAPLSRTGQVVLRLHDTWVGIKDEEEQVIGNIRVKVYLEDLGKKAPGVVLAEPQSTDYQAAWELEMWRRAEEAKWKATLKDKENLHLAEVTDQYRTQEKERSDSFKKTMTELHQQDARMRAMMIELQNREQRLLGLEEELKLKMNDSMRQITTKEEECASLRSRMTEQRNESNKKIAALNGEIAKYRDDMSKIDDEMRKARREQDSPQVLHLQKELAAQTLQSAELQRKLDSANAQKEKYRQQCEGMKASLNKLNAQYQEEKKAWESREREELTRFRLMAGAQVSSEEARELQEVKQGLAQLQQTIPSQTLKPPSLPPPDNSLRAPVAYNKSLATKSTPAYSAGNKLVQLREERQRLLEEGYGYDDPLILEFDAQITSLSRS